MRVLFPAARRARGLVLALALLVTIYLVTGRAWAQGTIVHVVPPQPIYYNPTILGPQTIDLNSDGAADFVLYSDNGLDADLDPLDNNAIVAVPEPSPDLGAFIYALNQGAPISSSLDPVLAWWGRSVANGPALIVGCANIGCLGYFQNQTDAYAGIQLKSGISTYYGWIHIQNLGLNLGQISDWAYQASSDAPIFAGQVPEPGASTLLILGAALIGFRRWSRNALDP